MMVTLCGLTMLLIGNLSLSKLSTRLPKDHQQVRFLSLHGSIKLSPVSPDSGINVISFSLKLMLVR